MAFSSLQNFLSTQLDTNGHLSDGDIEKTFDMSLFDNLPQQRSAKKRSIEDWIQNNAADKRHKASNDKDDDGGDDDDDDNMSMISQLSTQSKHNNFRAYGRQNLSTLLNNVDDEHKRLVYGGDRKSIVFKLALYEYNASYLVKEAHFVRKYGNAYAAWPLKFRRIVDGICDKIAHCYCVCKESTTAAPIPLSPYRRSPQTSPLPNVNNLLPSLPSPKPQQRKTSLGQGKPLSYAKQLQQRHISSSPLATGNGIRLRLRAKPQSHHKTTDSTVGRGVSAYNDVCAKTNKRVTFACDVKFTIPVYVDLKARLMPADLEKIMFSQCRNREVNIFVKIINRINEQASDGSDKIVIVPLIEKFHAYVCDLVAGFLDDIDNAVENFELILHLQYIVYDLSRDTIAHNSCIDIAAYIGEVVEEFQRAQLKLYQEEINLTKDISVKLNETWPEKMSRIYKNYFNGDEITSNSYKRLFEIMAIGTINNIASEAREMCNLVSLCRRRQQQDQEDSSKSNTTFYKSIAFCKILKTLEID